MILKAFLRALGQMNDRRFRRVLFLGIGLSIALLIGASSGFVWLAGWLTGEDAFLPILGEVRWLDDLISWGSLFLTLVLSVFLMVPVASAITSMFLDEVAAAVEHKHYSHLTKAAKVPFSEAAKDTVNFLGILVAANVAAIFLYVIFPFAAVFIFWGMNGFLLGREYFTLAAMRRVGREKAKELRRTHAGTIWMAGTLMAIPLSVPLINLVIPILGAATFTNLFHQLIGTPRSR